MEIFRKNKISWEKLYNKVICSVLSLCFVNNREEMMFNELLLKLLTDFEKQTFHNESICCACVQMETARLCGSEAGPGGGGGGGGGVASADQDPDSDQEADAEQLLNEWLGELNSLTGVSLTSPFYYDRAP